MAIEVGLDTGSVAVAPGQGMAWTVTVRNTGAEPARCHVTVTGPSATWFWISQPELTVGAGEATAVRMGVRVPASDTKATGLHPYSVEVRVDGGDGPVAAAGSVDVQSLVDVAATLGSPDPRRRSFMLSVRNRGNTAATVALSVGAPATVEPASVVVGPGEVATAAVVASGRPGDRFDVEVRPEGGKASVVSGTVLAPAKSGRRWPWMVAVAAAVAVVAGILVSAGSGSDDSPATTAVAAPVDPANCPITGHLASDANGRDRPGVATPVRYSFLEARQGGCEPVRFNPCEPIHYVVNSAMAPPGGLADLQAAVAQLSAATGITFVNDGPTDEPPSINRVTFQPLRYGRKWAPILVVWAPGEPYRLDDKTPGGGRATQFDGVYVSGVLILNVDAITDIGPNAPLPEGFGEGATWGRVMIHELAHLIGLGHVLSPAEIMFTQLGVQRGRAEYHAGDLEGLRILGAGSGCITPPPVP